MFPPSLSPSPLFFTQDRLIFSREHASGYNSALAYSISVFVVEFPILMGTVLGYGLISYFLVGLRNDAKSFFTFLLIIFLVIQVGSSSFVINFFFFFSPSNVLNFRIPLTREVVVGYFNFPAENICSAVMNKIYVYTFISISLSLSHTPRAAML